MVNLEELKKDAKRILQDKKVKYVIGYRRGVDGYEAIPAFFKAPEECDDLVWDPTCIHNLVRFLRDEKVRKDREKEPDKRPVAIIAKGCDTRAINVLLQEQYISREDVFILGISCEETGVIDGKKLRKKIQGKKIKQIDFNGKDGFSVITEEGKTEVAAKDVMAQRCIECISNYPIDHDIFFGEKKKREPENPFDSLDSLQSMPNEKRWAFWKEHLEKCIRCYACRSVCPMCYCDECVVDTISFAVFADTPAEEKANKIKWLEKSPVSSENFVYHLVRAMHLAGRCIDCGECERVCPVDIPLRHLNKFLEKKAKELFDYQAGFDPEAPALISSFKEEDPEDFIR